MVMGTCVYHIAHRGLGNVLSNVGKNTELTQFTQALYDARELAMERMQKEAEELHAEGIVACNCISAIIRGVRTRRSSFRSARPFGHCAPTMSSHRRRWSSVSTTSASTTDGGNQHGDHAGRQPQQHDAVALAAPVLTLLVVAVIRKGAFFRPDIVVTPALTLALALLVPQVRDWARDHLAAVAAGVLATAWWIGDANSRITASIRGGCRQRGCVLPPDTAVRAALPRRRNERR